MTKPKNPGRAGKPKPPPKPKGPRPLTPLQAAFVSHYVVEKNATEAAKKAGYSPKSAESLGWQLLQIPTVRTAIDEKFRQQNERLDIRADRVLLEVFRLATVDIGQAYDENGNLKPIHEIPEEVRRCIESIETETEIVPGTGDDETPPDTVTVRKVKFATKKPVLELLLKHFGEIKERVEHSGKVTLEDLVGGSHDTSPEKD